MDIQLQPNDKKKKKSAMIWLLIFVAFLIISVYMPTDGLNTVDLPFSDLVKKTQSNEIAEVTIQGHHITGKLKNNKAFKSFMPEDAGLVSLLKEKDVKIMA